MHKLDHLVFGSFTLEEGTEFVEDILRTKLSDVGYHKEMGTHNRVIRISETIYLEVIAIDPKITNLNNRKWFNLDNPNLQSKLKKLPQIIGYVIEYKDINKYKRYWFTSNQRFFFWPGPLPNRTERL